MTDLFFALVSTYGPPVIGLTTFLSCLALPIPASFVMLAGGAFVASGDLDIAAVLGAAFGGAILGDQTGFRAGRYGGARLADRVASHPKRAALIGRARGVVERWGGVGVFLSTWLVAPLGPWVNLIAGGIGMSALRFTLWDAAGEAIWVALYVGLGWGFAAHIGTIASIAGSAAAALALGTLAVGLGVALVRAGRRHRP